MGIRASLRRQRQGLELLFSHAFSEARAYYRFEPRPAKGGCVLFQSRLPRSLTASSFRNSLLPRAVPAGPAKQRLDLRLEEQWRPQGRREDQSRRQGQLRLGGRNGPRTFRGSHDVRLPESGWLVG